MSHRPAEMSLITLTDRLLVSEMLTVPGEPNPGIAVLDMMMLL